MTVADLDRLQSVRGRLRRPAPLCGHLYVSREAADATKVRIAIVMIVGRFIVVFSGTPEPGTLIIRSGAPLRRICCRSCAKLWNLRFYDAGGYFDPINLVLGCETAPESSGCWPFSWTPLWSWEATDATNTCIWRNLNNSCNFVPMVRSMGISVCLMKVRILKYVEKRKRSRRCCAWLSALTLARVAISNLWNSIIFIYETTIVQLLPTSSQGFKFWIIKEVVFSVYWH